VKRQVLKSAFLKNGEFHKKAPIESIVIASEAKKLKVCSSGFLVYPQAGESNEFLIFHGLPEATEIHGQPEFLSPFSVQKSG
jgi:hypothetical protein